jgi:hypothetical protein
MKRTALILLAATTLGGCSVAMASKHKGVPLEQAMACQSRSCFLSLRDIQVLSSQAVPDGGMLETYKVLLQQGSTGRAVMHGVLDVATFGLWEVAGTPIEGSANKDKISIVTARYDNAGKLVAATVGDRLPGMPGAVVPATLPTGGKPAGPPMPTAPTTPTL